MPAGAWRDVVLDWARPAFLACRLCGRPLSRRVWSSVVGGEPTVFCDPDCEAMLHEYWLPRNATTPSPDG